MYLKVYYSGTVLQSPIIRTSFWDSTLSNALKRFIYEVPPFYCVKMDSLRQRSSEREEVRPQRDTTAAHLKGLARNAVIVTATLSAAMVFFPTKAVAWRRDDDDRFRGGFHLFFRPYPPVYYAAPPVYYAPPLYYNQFPQIVYPPSPPPPVYPAPAPQHRGELKPIFNPSNSSSVIGASRYGSPKKGILPPLVFGAGSQSPKTSQRPLLQGSHHAIKRGEQPTPQYGLTLTVKVPPGCTSKTFTAPSGIPTEVKVTCTAAGVKTEKFYPLRR